MNLNIDSESYGELKISWNTQDIKVYMGDETNRPCPRSGHTLVTLTSGKAYMFGGLRGFGLYDEVNTDEDDNEDNFPSNEMFCLDLHSKNGMEWKKIECSGFLPLPRWRHSCTVFENTKLLIFGGSRNSEHRLNDVWVFDTTDNSWYQPNVDHNIESSFPHPISNYFWPNVPTPRTGHTASAVGHMIYVFGGYGGLGYGRRDMDDLYSLNTQTWQWTKLLAKGTPPDKRSAHKACVADSKIFIIGGLNCAFQFQDIFSLNVAHDPPVWSKLASPISSPLWNHCICSVNAIPTWKIFIFGGIMGPLSDSNRIGFPSNNVQIVDTETGKWTVPTIAGNIPKPRSDSAMTYDAKGSRLIIFGGWSDYWHNDVYSLDVSAVVGPPYAITSLSPKNGPITGGTEVTITGIDFVETSEVLVRFSDRRHTVDVPGMFVSKNTLTCTTPDFVRNHPGTVDVRVSLNRDSFTTTLLKYTYFSVTCAKNCVIFGPGLISGCSINEETVFMIQARDESGLDRLTGGDQFTFDITLLNDFDSTESSKQDVVSNINIIDLMNGKYEVRYVVYQTGRYKISVKFLGTYGGSPGILRGSGVVAEYINESSKDNNNSMTGELLMKSIKSDVTFLKKFSEEISKALFVKVKDDKWTLDEHIRVLMSVKEAITRAEGKQESTLLLVERSECILKYLKEVDRSVPGLDEDLSTGKRVWDKIKREVTQISSKISPMMRGHVGKIRSDVQNYEAKVKLYKEQILEKDFYYYSTGSRKALDSLDLADLNHKDQTQECEKMMFIAKAFDVAKDIQSAQGIISEVADILRDFRVLWEANVYICNIIDKASNIQWSSLDNNELEDYAKTLTTTLKKLPKNVKNSDAFKGLDRNVKEFVITIPSLISLRVALMQERHWKELMTVVKTDFQPPNENPSLRIKDLLQLKLHSYISEIEEITEKAGKESKHESILSNLEGTWSTANFSMAIYKDTDVPILKLNDEVIEQLESDQMAVQSIVGGRYNFYKAKALEWQSVLGLISDVTQVLTDIQKTWSYLEPLFISSDEVKKELPIVAAKFRDVDSYVRLILLKAWNIKNIKSACMQNGLYESLLDLQTRQDECKKSLSEYLDGKRRQFPRFYFMSEADLLDLLSNSSQPEKVIKHVDKILLSTKEITLISQVKQAPGSSEMVTVYMATKFVAGVGVETVRFEPNVKLSGKAEQYLQTLLSAQVYTLSKCLRASIARYYEMLRCDWLLHKDNTGESADPAQIALLVGQIDYVRNIEKSISSIGAGDIRAMNRSLETCRQQLADLIAITSKPLSKCDRQRVMCMITMDAHNRDIVDVLIRDKISSTSDFQWQSKLRPMYIGEASSFQGQVASVVASAEFRICDAALDYGFEYLGNGPRLVVTPLTDRIYVTATQALNLKMGCAPSGPAGTGKTETTKDLASALGKCCYVFNCSPEMDYQSMGNIFKGLAASGSWGCFDEFNRLVPEVLSVCSVQFKSVCDGLRSYDPFNSSTQRVTIEGDTVGLDPTCGAFITMNPGYLGRSELPEGLKALFRPITVMVPDLVLICENMLMAEGFQSAKNLASKFYGLYSLLSELLSKQPHYDWGLRAVKSVLVVAGQLRRAEMALDEDALLLRALRDFNIPKIVQADEVVFFGLLNDLFPSLNPPRVVDKELSECISKACEMLGLWTDPFFSLKVTQLEELLDIRHCVFIMGPTGCGKSTSWKTLQKARNIRNPLSKVKVVDINPKVMATEDLYGHISMTTREWKDGLLSNVLRELGNIPNENPKWIILDGDLDANWIESMNSVMDDNRMLTLASNERIPLKSHMRMIFEIRDLKYATPATVSRAGVLYISTDGGSQWRSIVKSWIKNRESDLFDDKDKIKLQDLVDKYLPDCLRFYASSLQGVVHANDISIIVSVLRLLDITLTRSIIIDEVLLETTFVFCVIWGLGSALTTSDDGKDYQKEFSEWFRNKFKTIKIPSRDTVFDYWLDIKSNKFESWKLCPAFKSIEFDSTISKMSDITVPTAETASLSFWLNLLVLKGYHVMVAGPAGTGKTQLINGLLNQLNPEFHLSTSINMNYYTSATILQSNLEASLYKRTGSSYGPPGASKMVYFIDDLNLPELDSYGTQSAIALIRQHIDYKHWYDNQKLSLKMIDDCQYVAALNPTAGSFQINPRLQRHFSTFAVGMPSATSLHTIYLTFLDGHLRSTNFNNAIIGVSGNIVKGALAVHKEVSETFRKTAANFHYEFNIRHLSNIFQGLLIASSNIFFEAEKFVYLWLHESERVYGDRLVDNEDLQKFKQIMLNQAKRTFPQFNTGRYYLSGGGVKADPLIFCHFADSHQDSDDLSYDQCVDIKELRHDLDSALHDYNETNPVMNLVLFDDAILHIARIVRIIKQVGGHGLLVGVGGSGKQSLSRLAAHICGYSVNQIVVNQNYGLFDFKSDLQIMYNKAGVKQEGVLFLLTDTQITNEKFFVYLNDLLSSGNIPDLYTRDERDAIIGTLTNKAKSAGYSTEPTAVWKYFLSNIRANLHCCFCFSPVGGSLRVRARRFPALASCTVIDWFQPWPEQALASVGKKLLSNLVTNSVEISKAIEYFMPTAFLAVSRMCKIYKDTEGRKVYTTPKSYLEMLNLFQSMLNEKRNETDAKIYRLQNGVEKLLKAAGDVVELEINLKAMLFSAEEKSRIAERIATNVQNEKIGVELENEKAKIEEEKVANIQSEVSLKQADAMSDLQQAEPALERAMHALDSLDRKDLGNCKTMAKPPSGVEDVFGAVMVLLAGTNQNIIIQKNGKVREKERTWEASKKALLGNINTFMDELKNFKTLIDNNVVPEINWKEIRPFIALEHFLPEVIEKRNSAAAGLCAWVINIVNYHDIVELVNPKRIALKAANDQLEIANKALIAVQERVAALQEKLDVLTTEYNAAEAQRLEAQNIAEKGKMKLELARRLITALGSEEERWNEGVKTLSEERHLLLGDCLLAAAFISYIGPFSKQYREKLMDETLIPLLVKPPVGAPVPMTNDMEPIGLMSSEAEVAEFQTQGLPADSVSSENAAIVLRSARYPLMVDPQLQAIKWIKKREGVNLQTARLGQKNLISRLLTAIENGNPFLIENMGEHIEPSLMPIISRVTTKRGGKKYLILGDQEVSVSPSFKLYLHTKLSNPHYPPEIQAETTVVNFSVTQLGLEEQLLAIVVRYERPDLASQRAALIMQQNLFTIKVKKLEDNILKRLAEATGDITEDRALIEELELSKKLSNEIAIKLEESRLTSEKIDKTSEKYRPVAKRGSLLFFVMNSLYKIHSYYMFSLKSFLSFFLQGITTAVGSTNTENDNEKMNDHNDNLASQEMDLDTLGDQIAKRVALIEENDRLSESADLPSRLKDLMQSISVVIYDFIRMGLFENHKLIVATMISLRIQVDEGLLDPSYVQVLLRGRYAEEVAPRGEELSKWLSESAWARIKAVEEDLSPLDSKFENFTERMASDAEDWEEWYNTRNPENQPMPGDFKELNVIQRLILIRILRPDKIPNSLSQFVKNSLGEEFITQPPFSMANTYKSSIAQTPILFVLYPGVDPTSWVEEFGKQKGITVRTGLFANISMGQGQEARADELMVTLSDKGGWLFLQNVHLMQSWLPSLDEKLDMLDPHPDFRLFISAEPPPISYMKNMPEGLLQSCITVSNEPPSDIKANLSRAWSSFDNDRIKSSSQPEALKACMFGLCIFHSLMLGRRRFGCQGWSRAYGFNMGDLKICSDVLDSYLNQSSNKSIPWQDLRYLFGEIFYGGHITDYFDRRTNNTYLNVIFTDKLLKKGEVVPKLVAPDPSSWDYFSYQTFISKSLPQESTSIYGLHPNAEIGFLTNKAENLFSTILTLEVGSTSSDSSSSSTGSTSIVKDTLTDLLKRLPEPFDLIDLANRAKTRVLDSDGPYVVVVTQECTKINALLNEISTTLQELQKGLNGQLNMSQAMEDMAECLSINLVPGRNPFHACSWEKLAWSSRKGLASWFSDLILRRNQLSSWSSSLELPYSVWLPGLINPTALLTAIKQVTSRKRKLPLDNMSLDTHVTRLSKASDAIAQAIYPDDGIYIHGLLLEGARWSEEDELTPEVLSNINGTACGGCIMESRLKQLLSPLPVLYVCAVPVQKKWKPESVGYIRNDDTLYECPVYTTSARGGTFIFLSYLRTLDPVHRWILAGVALLMQSDD